MALNSKINNLKEGLSKRKEKIEKLSLHDATTYYRRILKKLPDVSHLKNIVLFGGVATLLIFILFTQRFAALSSYLPTTPATGGTYTEGLVGKIEQLNPIFSPTNSAEEAGVKLIFSGLTKKDGNRNNIPDLADHWDISADGKDYTFYLKDNLIWHDGGKLTADDVVFTVNTIQNPDVRSPLLDEWRDVEVTKADEKTVTFKLKAAYAPFISNTDLPIIPKHILEIVPPRTLRVSEFSTKPVGSGPFKFDTLKKVKESDELSLIPNDGYYDQRPYLKKVILKTYPDESKMVAGYNKKEILGMEEVPGQELAKKSMPNLNAYQMSVPEYDVIYFNTRAGLTKDKAVREAISLSIDRSAIINNVYSGEAFPIYGPLLPGFLGFDAKLKQSINVETAKAKMAGSGFVMGEDGIFKSGETRASVRLLYPDTPEKNLEAEIIRDFLRTTGVEVKLEKYPIGALVQDHIRPRDFDLLLVAQNLGADSDLYALWHSSGVNDPGLNFSGLSSRLLDKNLEQGRTSLDTNVRAEKYSAAAKLITDETPAVFLVWPSYIYGVSRDVKGIQNERLVDPNDRFWNIASWYIDEKQAYR